MKNPSREDIRQVACPECGAAPGRPCTYEGRGAAKKMARGQNHHARQKSYQTLQNVNGHSRGRKSGVPVYFDPDQIEAVNKWRENESVSFSEAIRTLVEWGLESADV